MKTNAIGFDGEECDQELVLVVQDQKRSSEEKSFF